MSETRKYLVAATITVLIIGAIISSIPFLQSLAPADHLPEHTTELDISDLPPASSKLFQMKSNKKIQNADGSVTWQSGNALLVVKDASSTIYLYSVPTWEGKVMMPYRYWGQHEGYCPDLKAVFESEKEPIIKCTSSEWAEFLTKQWKWSLEGKNLGTDLPNMIKVGYRFNGKKLEAFY